MSEKHYPYIGGSYDRIVFDGDESEWVRIVRCRDCEHYKPWVLSRPENGGDCHLNKNEVDVTHDGFCAWGERKESGDGVEDAR